MILRWLFPEICFFCEQRTMTTEPICRPCFELLPWLQDACYFCGYPLQQPEEHVACHFCLEKSPSFDRFCALFHYEPPVTKFITDFKFNDRFQYANILGNLFKLKMKEWYKNDTLPQALIPVPLHIQRLRKRGYNQALELTKAIAKQSNITSLLHSCQRVKKVKPQAMLNKQQRRRNLKGVFQITQPLNYEHVAIVDDVMTTGSTVSALSVVLKESAVKRVDVICIARA